MDLSKFSDADLTAIQAGDMGKVSDDGLRLLAGSATSPASASDRFALRLKEGMDTLQSTPYIGGSFRALRDRAQAGAQIIGRAVASPETMREYEGLRQSSEASYQQARREQGDEGMDWDRLLTGAGLDAVVASRLPGMRGGAAPTMAGRMKQGAGVGLYAGAMTPVDSGAEGGSFLGTKLAQAGFGATIGAAAPLVIEPVIAGATLAANATVSKLAGFAKSATGGLKDSAIEFNLSVTLKSQGVDWNKLSSDVQQSLVADVRAALKAGRPITPEQVARYADFKALGTQATRGQTTLDPMLFKQEQNLKGISNVGEELTQRFAEQNRAVFDRLGQLRGNVPSQVTSPLEAGRAVKSQLESANVTQQARVRAAYDAAKNAAGRDTEVPMTRIAETFGEMRGRLDMDLLPGPVRQRLTSYGLMDGKQTKVFTLDDAEDLLKTISANYDPTKVAAARAMDQIRGAVKASIDDIADASVPAAGAFGNARQVARERFRALEATPALRAARENKLTPDDLLDRYVIGKGAKVDELENLFKSAPAAKDDVKAAVFEHLRTKAQGLSPDGAPQFQFATFAREVQRIGQDKLKLIFSPDEVAEINRLVRVGSVMNFNPRSVTINRSGTSQAIFDLMSRMQSVPFVNKLVAGPINSAIQSGQAYNAANSGLAGVPGGMLLSDALRAQLAERSGLLGAAAIAPFPANKVQ